MVEKMIKNMWFLLFTFLLVVAFASGAATLSFTLMNKPSTLAFWMGVFVLVMTIFIFAFWTFMIFNQMVVVLKEKSLSKKSKNRKR